MDTFISFYSLLYIIANAANFIFLLLLLIFMSIESEKTRSNTIFLFVFSSIQILSVLFFSLIQLYLINIGNITYYLLEAGFNLLLTSCLLSYAIYKLFHLKNLNIKKDYIICFSQFTITIIINIALLIGIFTFLNKK